MSNINQGDISKNENRTLAKWQPFITQDGEINYNFGKDFNEWFNDRFYLRESFVMVHKDIFSTFNSIVATNKAFYNKRTHWMFQKVIFDSNLSDIRIQREIADNFNRFNHFCSENNIKLYLLVVPLQDEIYYHNASPYITAKDIHQEINATKEILKYVKFQTIFPYDKLRQLSQSYQTYYKTDWHWTDDGAFLGQQELIKEIKKDFSDVKILSKNDFNITTSNKVRSDWNREFNNGEVFMFHFPNLEQFSKKILDIKYNYYEHKDSKNLSKQIIDQPFKKEKNYQYNNAGNNLKVLQMGTSMNESLLQFTPYSFNNVRYIRIISIKNKPKSENFKIFKYYKNEILEYKPDIIILCLTPRNLPCILDFFKE